MDIATITARMDRLWAYHGEDLGAVIHHTALASIATSLLIFVLVSEATVRLWARQQPREGSMQAPARATQGVDWLLMLLFLLVLASVNLASGEEWMALLGNPQPLLATLAMSGMDAPAGGAFPSPGTEAIQDGITQSLSGLATQNLLLSAGMGAWGLYLLHPFTKANMHPTSLADTVWVAAGLGVLVIGAGVLLSPIYWQASFGAVEPYAAHLFASTPTQAAP